MIKYSKDVVRTKRTSITDIEDAIDGNEIEILKLVFNKQE